MAFRALQAPLSSLLWKVAELILAFLLYVHRLIPRILWRRVIGHQDAILIPIDMTSPSNQNIPTLVAEDSSMNSDDKTHSTDETFRHWFERVCEAVKRNDPEIDELELDCKDEMMVLNEDDMKTLADALAGNRYVRSLILQNMTIDDAASEHMKQLLRTNNSITSLTLEEVAGQLCMAVAMALTSDPISSVRELHMRDNTIDDLTAQALGLMLRSNRHLVKLRFCHNNITPEGVSSLSLGLSENKGLQILDLCGNRLSDECIAHISNALVYNKKVEYLSLDFNYFGTFGTQAISFMLRRNRRLRELHLFGNRIDVEGARALGDSLRYNQGLHTLILSFNNLGDIGAEILGEALTINKTLTKLWMPSNGISHVGFGAVGACLPYMSVLEELNVGDFFDNRAAEGLLTGLQKNTRLVALSLQSPISEFCGSSCVEDKLDFFLRMNRSGRSILQASPETPLSLWPLVLAKANKNQHDSGAPDVLYHMLRSKPDLMELPL